MSEEIIGRLNGLIRVKDIMGTQTYNLIFTTNRIVAELIGDTGAGTLVGGFGVDLINKRRDYKKALEMNEQKHPDLILSENKKNFEINNYDIEKITLQNCWGNYSINIKFNQKIKKIGKDIQFEVKKDRKDELKQIILKAYPNITIVKN